MSDKHIWGPLVIDNTAEVTASGTFQATNEAVVHVRSSVGAITVSLPMSPSHGQCLWIKDSGSAATHNITVSDPSSKTIDGAGSLTISSNYAAVLLQWDGLAATPEWRVIASH